MPIKLNTIFAILFSALFVGFLTCYFLFSYPFLSTRLNNIFYDFWLTSQHPPTPHPVPVIIDFDAKSINSIGQLPWSRTILADLVTTLLYDGVKAIGLDAWLTEPDRSSPIAVDGELEKNFGLNLDLSNIPPIALDNDRYFRDQIAGKPVITGAFATTENNRKILDKLPEPLEFDFTPSEESSYGLDNISTITGLLSPLPLFVEVAPVGILNARLDEDGQVRSMPMLLRMDDKIYPGLALRTLMTAIGVKKAKLNFTSAGLESIQLGELNIPVSPDGSFRPIYRGIAKTFPHYSAIDVLEGKVGKKELEGKIAFLGPATHSLNMLQSTPLDPAFPETEIHATIIDNILTGSYVRIPVYANKVLIGACFLAAIAGSIAFYLFSLPTYTFFALGSSGLCLWGSWYAFQKGEFLSPVAPIFALFLAAILILPYRYWHEQAEKRKFKQAFNHYVSPEVVNQVVTQGEKLLKGEQKEVSILFTDVRGFTSISENLPPTQLVRLLNFYFTPMTACVKAHQGTLDKFIGDALMAFWNAPINIEKHPQKAILAALDMQKALDQMQDNLKNEFGINLKMGIGINTGVAHVGNMGSDDLMDYTCIGDNVNLASRIEGMCKYYGVDIVISSTVMEATKTEFNHVLLDRINVKGSTKPLEIYTPLDPDMRRDRNIDKKWREALELYFSGNFEKAFTKFSDIAQYPFFNTASKLFLERCRQLANMKIETWDGVWRFIVK